MSLGKHLEQAVKRLEEAERRIGKVRNEAATLEGMRNWLVALSDFTAALSDIQRYNNESVHEKLHELAERIGMKSGSPHRL